jgi:hypothetical protein
VVALALNNHAVLPLIEVDRERDQTSLAFTRLANDAVEFERPGQRKRPHTSSTRPLSLHEGIGHPKGGGDVTVSVG